MLHNMDGAEYSVQNRKEIVSILEGLKRERVAIRLNTSHGDGFITSVLAINSGGNLVYLDVSPDAGLNSKIQNSRHTTFATHAGITVKWHATHVSLVKLPDGDALSTSVPAVVQRIQRREYFRVSLPQGSNGMTCKIVVWGEVLEASIKDMSAGGVGLLFQGPLPVLFSQGEILQECSIEFPGVGVVRFKLKICGIRVSGKATAGDDTYHVGMEFIELGRAASNVVQRYIIELESRQLAA